MATAYQKALWAQSRKEIQQNYDYAGWNRDYSAGQLQNNVMNNALSRGVARSSIVGSEVGQGMVPINKQYSEAGLNYQNALARLALEQKYGGSGGGGARLPAADPAVPAVASSPSLGQAVNAGIVPWKAAAAYTGFSPNSNTATTTTAPRSVRHDWWRKNV